MTTEIKTKTDHYYINDAGQNHGEFKMYHSDAKLWIHTYDVNGKIHGEYTWQYDNGNLAYHSYWVNNVEVHNFINDGDSEFIRVCLYITHGAPFLT